MADIYGQLVKAQFENLSSDPSNNVTGLVYYNILSNVVKWYDGTAWRTGVDTASSQVITNKDVDGGTASNTSRVTVPKAATATLDGLTRKAGTVVYDTTTSELKVDNGAALVALAATNYTDYPDILDNFTITGTVGSSALTIALKTRTGADPSSGSPVKIGFRSSTTDSGAYNVRSVSAALSVVVSSGSTLGHASNVEYPIWIYAIDNAGTVELAVSTTRFDDAVVQSTSAEGGAGAADSAGVMYSTTARSSVPVRLIGQLLSTQSTAGTWATKPQGQKSGNYLLGPAGQTKAGLCVAGQVPGQPSNTAIGSGYIGEKLQFTARTISSSAGNYVANSSALTTLTAGIWLLICQAEWVGSNTASYINFGIYTNSNADNTGLIGTNVAAAYVNIQNASAANSPFVPGMPIYYAASGSTPIYFKAFAEDQSSLTIGLTGFAVRIA